MWPTMRRKPKAVSAPSVVPTTEVNPPPASIPLEAEEISTHPPKAPAVTDSDSVNPLMPPNPFLDADGEMPGMEELLQTMMQAQAFRDQASSGSISDEDRRNQAAHFAMKLMELLNLGDDDDEEN